MKTITLAFDYTVNGAVKWAANVAHEATEELSQLLTDGVDGIENEVEAIEGKADEAQ